MTLLSSLPLADWLAWRLEPGEPAAGIAEESWMARVASGDDAALQSLFDRWKLPLLGFFYRAVGSHADAEDLTLETFVRLHRSAAEYRPSAKFSTYLFHIAHNVLRNEWRRRRRKPAQPVAPETFDYLLADPAETGRLAELEEVFQRALLRLPEKYRTPLLLLQQQQLGYPEAAAVLRVSENSLRVLVHRGRQMLKTEMEALS